MGFGRRSGLSGQGKGFFSVHLYSRYFLLNLPCDINGILHFVCEWKHKIFTQKCFDLLGKTIIVFFPLSKSLQNGITRVAKQNK
jgi:hypothetical protein